MADPDDAPGAAPARFVEVGTIGQGAMGEVMLVRERSLGREVALKRVLPGRAQQPLLMAHFEREARITAQLDHPGIVPVYEMTRQADGALAYTMKVVRGITLQELITRCREDQAGGGPMAEDRALPARLAHFVKVCEAVHYAHQRGFIHRDLKPANIMIGPFSEVYVMDWGIARPLSDPDDLDEAAAFAEAEGTGFHPTSDPRAVILGTPRYMAPEQARGEVAAMGPASDQYSLGLILQELVTLEPALPGEGAATLLGFAAEGIRSAVRSRHENISVDPELRAIIDKACALDPAARYPSVRLLSADVVRHLGGRAVQARPDNAPQALARWLSQHKQVMMLVLVGLLTAVFASSTAFLLWQRHHREATLLREARLTQVITAAADRSHFIYEHLLVYEGIVHTLASAAAQVLTHPPAGNLDYFDEAAFDAGEVPDLAQSARYGRPVSIDWPVLVVAPDAAPDLGPTLTRLATLRPTLRSAGLRSAGEAVEGLSAADLGERVRDGGIPLLAAYVGVEQGVHIAWPGQGGYPQGYDPRARPWYTETVAQGGTGARWSPPYVDALGLGVVMPCTLPIRDDGGALLGVAGVELAMGTVLADLLALDLPGVTAVWLVDARGLVLAPLAAGQAELQPFHLPEVVAEVAAGRSGWREGLGPDGATLAIYYTLGNEGLAYIVEGRTQALLGE